MSDLQCAVTVLVADAGGERAAELAASVADLRVASVWCSADSTAVRTAHAVAAALGVRVTVREGLDGDVGDDRAATVSRMRTVLEEVADTHRGETALLVSHGPAMSLVLPVVAGNLRADHAHDAPLAAGAVVELAGDSDAWVCRSWAGQRFG